VIETVPQGEGEKLRVTEPVPQPLTDLVKGRVVGTPVTEIVLHGDAEYVTDGLIERVYGCVVGIPVTETVEHPEDDLVIVTERVNETETVGVAGLLDATGVPERVIVRERVIDPVTV